MGNEPTVEDFRFFNIELNDEEPLTVRVRIAHDDVYSKLISALPEEERVYRVIATVKIPWVRGKWIPPLLAWTNVAVCGEKLNDRWGMPEGPYRVSSKCYYGKTYADAWGNASDDTRGSLCEADLRASARLPTPGLRYIDEKGSQHEVEGVTDEPHHVVIRTLKQNEATPRIMPLEEWQCTFVPLVLNDEEDEDEYRG